jgi:hypothetical protein
MLEVAEKEKKTILLSLSVFNNGSMATKSGHCGERTSVTSLLWFNDRSSGNL